MKDFPSSHVHLNTPVTRVSSESDGRVRLHLPDGSSSVYDHVVLATHGDQASRIIEPSATRKEKAILQSFQTSENTVVLHSDLSLMPTSPKAWTSWNYLSQSSPSGAGKQQYIDQVSLTFDMNTLQHMPRDLFGNVFVTLNPLHEPDPAKTQARFTYRHPLYTPEAVRAQNALAGIQNVRGISYAGAWTKYGFHEDGFSSGLKVAKDHLGAELPFEFVDSTYSRGRRPELGIADQILRLAILLVQVLVVQVLERAWGVARDTAAAILPVEDVKKALGNAPVTNGVKKNGKAE